MSSWKLLKESTSTFMEYEEDIRALRPAQTKEAMKAKFKNSLKWRSFARWVTRNSWMRRHVADLQSSLCVVCGIPIENIRASEADLHHKTYDWICTGPNPIQTLRFSKTHARPISQLTPDCKNCYERHPDKVAACAQRLAMVHLDCHGKIHYTRSWRG